ncbi:MAG: WD40 repeat domain-containing protein [Planctomycetes bacterium]|nr:WD40 repeat domain-containing protein [Planctomycetota bacterium]
MAPSRTLLATLLLSSVAVCPAAAQGEIPFSTRDLPVPPARSASGKQLHHPDLVTGAAWSSDGRRIYSACADGVLRLWDAATGRPAGQNDPAAGPLTCVAGSPDARRIAAGSRTGRILVWDVGTLRPLFDFAASEAAIATVAFAPGTLRLVATDVRGGVRVHSFLDGEVTSRDIALQGSRVLSARFARDRNHVLTSGAPARFHNLESPADSLELALSTAVEEVSVAIDAAPTGFHAVCAHEDGSVRLYSLNSGFPVGRSVFPRESPAVAVRWSTDDLTIVLGRDGTMWVCDPLGSFRSKLASAHPGSSILDASPDGTRILACLAADQFAVFDRSSGQRRLPPEAQGRGVEKLAIAADGAALLVAREDGEIDSIDPSDGRRLRTWALPDQRILALAACDDGRILAATYVSGFVRVRDVTSGQDLVRYAQPECPAFSRFSSDGSVFACAAPEGSARVWDLTDGTELACRPAESAAMGSWTHRSHIAEIAIAPRGDLMATCTPHGAALWNPATGALLAIVKDPRSPDAAAFSPDGFLFAAASLSGVWVRSSFFPDCRQVAAGQKSDSRGLRQPSDVLFSPVPKRAAVLYPNHGLLPFDPLCGGAYPLLVCAEARCAVFLPDGKTLAAGLSNGAIRLWDLGEANPAGKTDDPLDHLWGELACQRLERANAAAEGLAAAGDEGAKFLRERLNDRPAPETVARLVKDLASASAQDRREAREELEWLGVLAEPDLRRALNGDLTDTVRRNLEDLISVAESRAGPSRSNWQRARALLSLELSGTAQALDVLQRVADDSPSPRERADADAAVRRLRMRAAGGGK